MKRHSFQSIFLAILILTSLFLSYLLIFDNNVLLSRFSQSRETAQVNIQNDNTNSVTNYYKTSNVKLSDILYPTTIIISQGNSANLLNDYQTLRALTVSLSQKRITMVGDVIVPTYEEYIDLIAQERIEFSFTTPIPFELMDMYIKSESDVTSFEFNRIIFPKSETTNAYLVNSLKHEYMKATLPDGMTSQEYMKVANLAKSKWVKAERYNLSNNNHVYLPTQSIKMKSQVYTLNSVPETNVIDSLFGNIRSWRQVNTDEDSSNGTIMYFNASSELQINPNSQMLNIKYKNANQFEGASLVQRIKSSHAQMRQFEYWVNGIRYGTKSDDKQIVFRRYLDGYPIFDMSAVRHYASSTMQLSSSSTLISPRLTVPMLFLEAHIVDQSREYDLMTVEEVAFELNMAGFYIDEFSNITIGYEWQEDMANFQKVTFIPKWFFEYNGTYYTLDQIKAGALNASSAMPQRWLARK